jgi:hypothetical protein
LLKPFQDDPEVLAVFWRWGAKYKGNFNHILELAFGFIQLFYMCNAFEFLQVYKAKSGRLKAQRLS